ncbi:MAG TPA: hypothetical protein PKM59_10060, partial [Thermodesulfobacteriota bacterium]|nr:hypothetical protein [Thermodesulfobacteriota bacterium]
AKAGIQSIAALLVGTTFYRALIASTTGFSSVVVCRSQYWIPACAGMTATSCIVLTLFELDPRLRGNDG